MIYFRLWDRNKNFLLEKQISTKCHKFTDKTSALFFRVPTWRVTCIKYKGMWRDWPIRKLVYPHYPLNAGLDLGRTSGPRRVHDSPIHRLTCFRSWHGMRNRWFHSLSPLLRIKSVYFSLTAGEKKLFSETSWAITAVVHLGEQPTSVHVSVDKDSFQYKIKIQWKLHELTNKLMVYTRWVIYIQFSTCSSEPRNG